MERFELVTLSSIIGPIERELSRLGMAKRVILSHPSDALSRFESVFHA
jgi:hypothetical protein